MRPDGSIVIPLVCLWRCRAAVVLATFTFKEQRLIIRFLHLPSMVPIEIHQQLSDGREKCASGCDRLTTKRRVASGENKLEEHKSVDNMIA